MQVRHPWQGGVNGTAIVLFTLDQRNPILSWVLIDRVICILRQKTLPLLRLHRHRINAAHTETVMKDWTAAGITQKARHPRC